MGDISQVLKEVSLGSRLTPEELAKKLSIASSVIKKIKDGSSDELAVACEKIRSLVSSPTKQPTYGPVTLIISTTGFVVEDRSGSFEAESLVRKIPCHSIADGLSLAFWYFQDEPNMQAMILDGDGEICFSVKDLKNMRCALSQVYGVQVVSKKTGLPLVYPETIDNFSCSNTYPTYDEALKAAMELIEGGSEVVISTPQNKRLNTGLIAEEYSKLNI